MKIKLFAILVLSAFILSGCGLYARFEQARNAYLEQRVNELLDTLPEDEPEEEQFEVPAEEVVEEPSEEAEPEPTEEPEPAPEETKEPTKKPKSKPTKKPTEEPTPEPSPTITSDDPAVYLGEADWVDDMEAVENWQVSIGELTSAEHKDGAYVITALSETTGWRVSNEPVLKNVYIEALVSMGECAKTDGYGLYFRIPENVDLNQGYLFGITCDGQYAMKKWDKLVGDEGKMEWLKYYTASEVINQGVDASNRIGVMAVGDRLILFINGEMIHEVSDDAYQEGFFGIYVNRDVTEDLTIAVDDVKYWVNPQEK